MKFQDKYEAKRMVDHLLEQIIENAEMIRKIEETNKLHYLEFEVDIETYHKGITWSSSTNTC